jgi:hypothetical protein
MPVIPVVYGIPGLRAALTATMKIIWKGGVPNEMLPQGKLIDGNNARDPTSALTTVLQPGCLLGKITSTPIVGGATVVGEYGSSVIDVTAGAYTSGGTTITLSLAGAAELVRRLGTSGSFAMIGPATAGGPNQNVTVAYSAVVLSTGVVTITSAGTNFVAGAFICPLDGSQFAATLVGDGYGINVVDTDGITAIAAQFPEVPIGGTLISTQIVNWPTEVTLQAWIASRLNGPMGGQFVFDSAY